MSMCNPSDVLYLNAKKIRLFIDLLQTIPPGKDLLLSPNAVEGLETVMREQEAFMKKLADALGELPHFEVEIPGVET